MGRYAGYIRLKRRHYKLFDSLAHDFCSAQRIIPETYCFLYFKQFRGQFNWLHIFYVISYPFLQTLASFRRRQRRSFCLFAFRLFGMILTETFRCSMNTLFMFLIGLLFLLITPRLIKFSEMVETSIQRHLIAKIIKSIPFTRCNVQSSMDTFVGKTYRLARRVHAFGREAQVFSSTWMQAACRERFYWKKWKANYEVKSRQ